MKKTMILILAVMACLFAWYAWSFADGSFSEGNATITGRVESVRISWTSGLVTVAYHDADTVLLEEKADRPVNGNDRMRWKMDGTTLVVEYNTPRFFSFFSPSKALTVTLPQGISLKRAEIEATSADIVIPEMAAEEVVLGSTSGDVSASVAASAVSGGSTSGSIDLKVCGSTGNVKLGTTSGMLSVAVGQAENVALDTTSGGIRLEAEEVGKAALGSTSGDISAQVKAFGQMHIGATSGSVNAALSAAPGFTAKVSTTSGDFSSDIPLSKDGNSWSCGDGSAALEIGTTSGDVKLAELK